MATSDSAQHEKKRERISQLKAVRAEALKHHRLARELADVRRELIRKLIDDGVSQAEIARELGVTRQAVQKMLAT
jgi:DNA invertase Pin-like site-specific DNA recombinase